MGKSKSGNTLYLMFNFPFVIFWKIGITGKSTKQRAKGISDEMLGLAIPVMAVIIPGAYHVEQTLHRAFRVLNVRFYRGSGHSEWFWFPVAIPVLLLMAIVWVAYGFGIYLILSSILK